MSKIAIMFALMAVLVFNVESQTTKTPKKAVKAAAATTTTGLKIQNSVVRTSTYCLTKRPSLNITQCCLNYPKNFIETYRNECLSTCEYPKTVCCFYECSLMKGGAVNSNGSINGTLYSESLKKMANDATWNEVIGRVVNNCVTAAPSLVANWTSVMRNFTCKNNPQIMPIDHCIWRSLFLNCPSKVASPSCDSLYIFAEDHPAFPRDTRCPSMAYKKSTGGEGVTKAAMFQK